MYILRFNPVFNQWVLLGAPIPAPVTIAPGNLLDIGKTKHLVAATYPRPIFMVDERTTPAPGGEGRLYTDQAPIGEYELFLGFEHGNLFSWSPGLWEEWISLLQLRLLQVHHNPQLHQVLFALHTNALGTVQGYQRVGDLLATSHAIAGELPVVTPELAEKIGEKDWLYKIKTGKFGFLYVPSAPLAEHEIWYLPTTGKAGFEEVSKDERTSLAEMLSHLMAGLHAEYPHDHYVLRLYTSIASPNNESIWWLRVHRDIPQGAIVPLRSFPEPLVRHLKLHFTEH